ncbi:MAG: flippase-like domain-containing protein [Flavobacteriaceae bacterium]|nr:flippase-like domain-containing protein [Flavobacteriaceae bacterium]
MKARSLKILKLLFPILLGVLVIVLFYRATTPKERDTILLQLQNAEAKWIAISVFLGMLSHWSRASRWKLMLQPLQYNIASTNSFLIVLTAYLANLGIPRSGEILRATALHTYEEVPFEKGFGTIVTERIIDLVMLLIIVCIAFFLQTETILDLLSQKGIDPYKIVLFAIAALGAGLFFLLVIRQSSHPFAIKIKKFVQGLLEGVFSIFKMPKKGLFILHTIFIWSCYVGMFWILKFAFPETFNLGLDVLLAAFVAGAFAMTASNGGLGFYPIAVAHILILYGVGKTTAEAYGWLMWITQTLMVIIFGSIAFILLPLRNNNRK